MPGGTFPPSKPASRKYALQINGRNVLPFVPLDEAPVTWSDQAANGVGTMEFVVEDRNSWATRLPLQRGADVKLRDQSDTSPLFGGTLLRVSYVRGVTGRFAECTVADYDWWLDHRVVPKFTSKVDTGKRVRRMTSDRNIVAALIERRMPMIRSSWDTLTLTNSDMPLIEVEGVTARQALEEIADAAQTSASPIQRHFYVDSSRRLHWYKGRSDGGDAPYVIGGDTSDGAFQLDSFQSNAFQVSTLSSTDVEDLELEYDATDVVVNVFIRGKNKDGSGWVYDKGSIFEIGATSAFLDRPKSATIAGRNRAGRAFLRRQEVIKAGSFKVQATSGWRSGQKLVISDTQLGLDEDEFEILVVNGELGPGSHLIHRIEFGAPKRRFTRDLRRRDK